MHYIFAVFTIDRLWFFCEESLEGLKLVQSGKFDPNPKGDQIMTIIGDLLSCKKKELVTWYINGSVQQVIKWVTIAEVLGYEYTLKPQDEILDLIQFN